jgi:type II secretory pathway component PulC
LVAAIDAGLGRWLKGVDVEPARQAGRFRGWIVRRVHPDDPCYKSVDLVPGDLVLRVNGRAIERPEQANEVFSGLRTARTLTVDYLRDDRPRTLRFAISD